ncbi:MAG: hypothetical protein MUC87_00100 [Bacteroidia bacterium]|nr:hypothetical protein [Bacteroidia bacterium]
MELITDDLQIFELLEKAGKADFDPSQPHVLWFRHDDRAHLFLFQPQAPGRGCRLYLMNKEPGHNELERELLPQLIALPERHEQEAWMKSEALRITELLIHSKNYGLRFFDAH